jgi:iron complex transport system ATP-binding protein
MTHASDTVDAEAPLIEIRKATIWRGDTRVFEDFDLTILQHEQVAILGPNGSGKTTLLKVVNREIYPVVQKGATVRILGRERWNVWELRSHIGIVSHDLQTRYRATTSGLNVVLSGFLSSVGVHGQLARRIERPQVERARAIMADLGVADLAGTPLAHMSTGQQRRCLLARALVHDPHTLILDEPTAGLDLAASFDYLTRVRSLVTAGRNIVLVTHALNEIPPAIDRVILLRAGKIVADGAKDTVLTETNLQATYGIPMRIARIDGYYLAYPGSASVG